MKVSGFTFIRNAVTFDYPIVEAIRSILPLCDELIVAVGKSEDATRSLIENINDPKIRIIDTVWDDSLREGGKVLAVETDKAFKEISVDSDWAIYIQGDEVLHEKYHPAIRKTMLKWKDDQRVEGLLFNYLHFYGSYDYVGDSYSWYSNEIRIVRTSKNIYSYRDAQGFRKDMNQKLNVKKIDATIYHYGWVKDPRDMQRKQLEFHKLWHDDKWIDNNIPKAEEFDYSTINSLRKFKETHPAVMEERIMRLNWKFNHDISKNKKSLKDIAKRMVELLTGYRLGYRNYRLLRF